MPNRPQNKIILILCSFILFAKPLFAEHDKTYSPSDNGSQILAIINNQKITVSDFEKEMIKQGGLIRERFNNMDEKKRILDEMIRFELFSSEALKAGYDKDPEIVEDLKKRIVQKYIHENIEPQMQGVNVTDGEINAYYQKHIAEYQRPSLVRIAIIWIKAPDNISEKERNELKKKAEEALIKAKEKQSHDNSLGEIAKQYSDDTNSKYKGGDIGWLSAKDKKREDLPPQVLDTIFSLKEIGEISPVIDTKQGFYIIKLMRKKIFRHVPLEEARPEIQYKLYSEKKRALYKDYYEKIKDKADITINLDLLRSISGQEIIDEMDKNRPPSFPVEIE